MILINGEERSTVDASDRGLAYGDGLFETIEITDEKAVHWLRHFERLQLGCQVLSLTCPDEDILVQECEQLIAGVSKAVVKIIITRGSTGRGYRPSQDSNATRILSIHPWPKIPNVYYDEGIRLYSCKAPVSINSKLAGIKTLCRLDQVLAQSEWVEGDYEEGLMFDDNQLVIEGTKTNIFIIKQGKLYTPLLKRAGIKGIMREIVIEIAQVLNIPIIEIELSKTEVIDADEIFVCNSIIKIWPVREFLNKHYAVGEITRKFINNMDYIE